MRYYNPENRAPRPLTAIHQTELLQCTGGGRNLLVGLSQYRNSAFVVDLDDRYGEEGEYTKATLKKGLFGFSITWEEETDRVCALPEGCPSFKSTDLWSLEMLRGTCVIPEGCGGENEFYELEMLNSAEPPVSMRCSNY